MSKWILIETFDSPTLARLSKELLELRGMDAILEDENVVANDWLLSTAVGGVKLLVLESDVPTAVGILREEKERRAVAFEKSENKWISFVCGKCNKVIAVSMRMAGAIDTCPECSTYLDVPQHSDSTLSPQAVENAESFASNLQNDRYYRLKQRPVFRASEFLYILFIAALFHVGLAPTRQFALDDLGQSNITAFLHNGWGSSFAALIAMVPVLILTGQLDRIGFTARHLLSDAIVGCGVGIVSYLIFNLGFRLFNIETTETLGVSSPAIGFNENSMGFLFLVLFTMVLKSLSAGLMFLGLIQNRILGIFRYQILAILLTALLFSRTQIPSGSPWVLQSITICILAGAWFVRSNRIVGSIAIFTGFNLAWITSVLLTVGSQ